MLLMSKMGRRMDLLNPRLYDSASSSLLARSVSTNISPRRRNIGYDHKQIVDDTYFYVVTKMFSLGRH